MHFTGTKKAVAHFKGEGMEVFTQQQLEDRAWELILDHDADAKVSEWFLVLDGLTLKMVILYKKAGVKGIYAHQVELAKP